MSAIVERASAVAKHVELQSVSLTAATLSTNVSSLQLPDALEIQSRYRARHTVEAGSPSIMQVMLDFGFEGRVAGDDSSRTAIKLEATFTLVYHLADSAEYPEGALDDFAKINGAYNAWPYWREMVQSVSGRVGFAGIIVPVFRASDFELRFSGRVDRSGEIGDTATAQPIGEASTPA